MYITLLTSVLAQVPPVAPGEDIFGWLLSSLGWVVQQMQGRNYLPGIGMIVMILVFAFHKLFESKIDKKWLPLVSALVGTVSAGAANLIALAAGYSTRTWLEALVTGLIAGATASGFWSLFGKWIASKVFPPKDSPVGEAIVG